MMSNDNVKWMNDLSNGYQWPQPSSTLKKRILNRVVSTQNNINQESFYDFLMSIFSPKMASAMACMMILGLCVGTISVPQSAAEAHTSPYMDNDLAFVQSIVTQHRGRDSE